MSVTDEIKSRLDIVAYVQQYASLKKAGRYYKACCPFHHEKTPSFVVDPDRQTWRCFGACAEGGDVFSFAMKQHGWTFSEALQELGRAAGVEVSTQSSEQRESSSRADKLRALLATAADWYHAALTQSPEGAGALQYALQKRAFKPETLTQFKIGYAPKGWQSMLNELTALGYSQDDIIAAGLAIKNDQGRVYDRFRNRLMIPIRDDRGRVVGFGARALDPDDNPKYLNSPQSDVFDKSGLLFGLDSAKRAIRDSETAVIVEGYVDAIQAQQNGFLNVVAQMGTALTETQLKLIAPRYAKRIILALDSDAAGQSATMRSLEIARQTLAHDYAGRLSVDIRVVQTPGAKDPDDFIRESAEAWRQLVENAVPVADYVIDSEVAHLSERATIQERETVARRVLPILLASENNLYNQSNVQRLALKLRISEADLLAWAQEERKKIPAPKPAPRQERPRPTPPPTPTPQPLPTVSTDDDVPYMPPLDIDALEVPQDSESDEVYVPDVPDSYVVPPPVPQLAPVTPQPSDNRERPLEAFCVQLVATDPTLLFHINRKLSEITAAMPQLAQDALSEFSAEDFTSKPLQVLMDAIRAALRQDDLSLREYLEETLEPPILAELEQLLADDADKIRARIKQRYDGDATSIWKTYEQRVLPFVDFTAQFIDKALSLRLKRLNYEIEQISFLQREAQESGDFEASITHGAYILRALQARYLIENEIQRLHRESRNFL